MTTPTPRRVAHLRGLSAQIAELRQDLRRTSSESLLLCAMEGARPLTPTERKRVAELHVEMWRIEQDLLRLRREYAALDEDRETAVHPHVRSPVRSPVSTS